MSHEEEFGSLSREGKTLRPVMTTGGDLNAVSATGSPIARSPTNREAKWREGYEELQAENLAIRKAMLKLEEQLREQKINLDEERLEKMELRNKLIDKELKEPDYREAASLKEELTEGSVVPFVIPPPGIHSGDEGDQASNDEDSESESGSIGSANSDNTGDSQLRSEFPYAESDMGSRMTETTSLLHDFDRSFKDMNSNYPRMPRTSSRARTSDLAIRFKKEADLTAERNGLLKKLTRCEGKLMEAKSSERKAVRKYRVLLRRMKRERSRRVSLKKSLSSARKKSGALSGHIEKLMVALRLEANAKQKQRNKEKSLQKMLDVEREKVQLLREKCSVADAAIVQLKEQTEMLAGQLQLADERHHDLRTRLEVERENKNGETAFWKKVAMKYEKKKAAKGSTKVIRRKSRNASSHVLEDGEPVRRQLKKRVRKGKKRTKAQNLFPTVPTLFPKRTMPEEPEQSRHLDYTTNIFPELNDVIGNDESVKYKAERGSNGGETVGGERPKQRDMKFSLGDIHMTETTLKS